MLVLPLIISPKNLLYAILSSEFSKEPNDHMNANRIKFLTSTSNFDLSNFFLTLSSISWNSVYLLMINNLSNLYYAYMRLLELNTTGGMEYLNHHSIVGTIIYVMIACRGTILSGVNSNSFSSSNCLSNSLICASIKF
jgi:hypothetical protein